MFTKTTDRLHRAYRFFISAKMTAIIIAVLVVIFLAGLIIPQKQLFSSSTVYDAWRGEHPLVASVVIFFHLNEIYVAPVTIFCWVLFFANLLLVMTHRIPLGLQRAYLGRDKIQKLDVELLKKRPNVQSIAVSDCRQDALPLLRKYLKKRLWSIVDADSERAFIAVKHRYSPIGFFLFHLSFLLCLLGGLSVVYTRFSGELVLTEGQTFNNDIREFRKIIRDPKLFKMLPPLTIELQRVEPQYDHDVATDLDVKMKVSYWNRSDDVAVKINHPVKRGPVEILPLRVGVSPLFVLSRPDGTMLDGGYVSLNVMNGEEDSFQFEGTPYTYFVRFYPDYAVENGREYSRTKMLKNPVVRLRIEKNKKIVYQGTMNVGDKIQFDSGSLALQDIRYWVNFLIVREYGNEVLFLGFFLAAVGLVMRLVLYQKTLHVAVEENGQQCFIWVDGRSEYYTYSFQEELAEMLLSLRRMFEARP